MTGIYDSKGFTLVEMAIVMVIVSLLFGLTVVPLSKQAESARINKTQRQMGEIKEAILGFVSAYGRIPCPARPNSAGAEQPPGGGACAVQFGFVPGYTLGLNGSYNADTLLLDDWGEPIRYSVTFSNGNAFTTTNGIRAATIATLSQSNDLFVCDNVGGGSNCGVANTIVNDAPFVAVSMGRDGLLSSVPDSIQGENSSEASTVVTGPANRSYRIPNDVVFVSSNYIESGDPDQAFNDIVMWVSPNVLFSKMISAGQLP